jgi:hypothetical protein
VVIGSPAYTPPVTRATLRRAAIGAAVVAVLALAVLIPLGFPAYALFGCVGIALGLLNMGLAVRSVVRFSETKPSKARFSGSVLGRLAVITVIAIGCYLLFGRPGIAVFGGLAAFQLLAVASSMVPLIKEIRKK